MYFWPVFLSLSLFSLFLLLPFSLCPIPVFICDLLGHLWTMTLPYTQISLSVCAFIVFFCFFVCFVLFFLSHSIAIIVTQKTVVDVLICVLLINNLSYPWLPMCDVQSGSSSALHADCALAFINWFCSRRKRIVWATEISGPRPLCFLCLLTLVQSHTRKK